MKKIVTLLAALLVSFNANADLCADLSQHVLKLERDSMRLMSDRARFEFYSNMFKDDKELSEDRKVVMRYLLAKIVEGVIWKFTDREAMAFAYEECTFFKQSTGLK